MKCIICGQEIREGEYFIAVVVAFSTNVKVYFGDLKGGMHIHCYEGLLGGEKGGK